MSKPKHCPVCGRVLHERNWRDEGYTVETIEECEYCGYREHWAYGGMALSINHKYFAEFTLHPHMSSEAYKEVEQQEKAFREKVERAKRYFKKMKLYKAPPHYCECGEAPTRAERKRYGGCCSKYCQEERNLCYKFYDDKISYRELCDEKEELWNKYGQAYNDAVEARQGANDGEKR